MTYQLSKAVQLITVGMTYLLNECVHCEVSFSLLVMTLKKKKYFLMTHKLPIKIDL
jgi:hypothetical protein